MAGLMGFKRVDGVPRACSTRKDASIYKPLLNKVSKTGETYALDTHDEKRARSLSATLTTRIKKMGYDNVRVCTRGTTVYVTPREERED